MVGIGLLVDAWLAARAPDSRRELLAVAAATPALLTAGYFAAVHLSVGVVWTVHLWAGAVYLTACVGALVGVLATADVSKVRSEGI